jgi:hypothetical protein
MSNDSTSSVTLTETYASKFAQLVLAHVRREYPNKLDHVLLSEHDVAGPRALHPIFYGSFDWHSCVHGYWLLARVLSRFPGISEADAIRALFDEHFTSRNVAAEAAYAAHASRSGFERPYGWSWLLMLAAELRQHATQPWAARLQPLADVFVNRWMAFLPKATYPVRVGTHYNTAFAVTLALEYAHVAEDPSLHAALVERACAWYGTDVNAHAWEPSGDDFLSSTLTEALCMQRALAADAFDAWMHNFLPDIVAQEPRTLFEPVVVSDRSDGKIAHLDGLNLSRAWCWRALAAQWSAGDARRTVAMSTADAHIAASLPHVAGDYMGEHWLATYALLALDVSPFG